MVTPEFKEAYKKLNPEQKLAVDTIEGPVMVVAGPGTGKTQILTLRIANILLQTDTNPENILALTFTESGVYQMQRRLADLIGTPGMRVVINTFHSFCNEVIKQNPEDFPHLISSNSITELEQIQLVEEILETVPLNLLRPFGDPLYYLRPALSAINELKKEGVTPDAFKPAIGKQQADFEKINDLIYIKGANAGKMKGKYQDLQRSIAKNEELLIIYTEYQKLLTERKLYDFNDMLLEVIAALERDENLLLRLQERYQYILVDEHQDTNAAQNKIIELLASFYDVPNLFVVGDEKQAIFRFQGASLENFLYFKKVYPDAILINLKQNYRSSQIILDAAGSLISNNILSAALFPEQVKLLATTAYQNKPLGIAEFGDFLAEYFWIGEQIMGLINGGVISSEIAVLSRNNKDLLPLIEILENLDVPYVLDSDASIFSDPDIKKMIFILRAIENLGNDADLVRALHMDFLDIDPLDIYKLIKYSQRKEQSLTETLRADNSERDNLTTYPKIEDFFKKIVGWNKKSHNSSLGSVFIDVLKTSGLLESVMKNKKSNEILDKFASLHTDIKLQEEKHTDFSLKDFLNYVTLLEQHQISIKKNTRNGKKLGVNLLTAHKSKGMEFEYVFIINAIDSRWGSLRKRANHFQIPWDNLGIKLSGGELDPLEDERRLFFVAVTRSKKEVFITFSNCGLDGRSQQPSQFVLEIKDEYKTTVDVTDFEKHFLDKKDQIFISPKEIDEGESERRFLESKEFFAEIFYERGLSATGLNNYLNCPWRFVFKNLLLLPDLKDKSQIFGSAIHFSLCCYLRNREKPNITEEYLLEKYNEYLSKEALTKKDKEELSIKGKKVLVGYFNQVAKKWTGVLKGEMVVKGVRFDEEIILNGRLDMVEFVDEKHIKVYDFKTGKPKSRNQIQGLTKSSNGDYIRQLIFYKILIEKFYNNNKQMTEGIMEFVEPTEAGEFKREIFEIGDEEVSELEQEIKRVAREIINLEFWNKKCDEPACEYCLLRSYIA